jgi:hypothetical protein
VSGFTTVVFSGPTLGHRAVREILDDPICKPPAAMGDVYRCLDDSPDCIAIIDGYFEGVPSVWHKEILYAMSKGVHVLGASSMGALRAAELADFGMQGVGKIFLQFHCGDLEDDDEVAVLHGPEELEFLAATEAMVNIRETLIAAAAGGVLSTADSGKLTSIAKSCFYHDRQWEHILSLAEPDIKQETLDQFRSWLADGAVDQKRLDALSLLQEIRQLQASKPPPFKAEYQFEWSEMWQNAITHLIPERKLIAGIDELVLGELRLNIDEYSAAVVQAGLHYLAQGEATPAGNRVDDSELKRVFNNFKAQNGLLDRVRLDSWLLENDLGEVDFEQLMESLARREKLIDGIRSQLDRAILDWLKLSGRYASLRARAECKQTIVKHSELRLVDDERPGLLRWYFEERLHLPVPQDLDSVLDCAGFDGRDHFYRSIFAEWVYLSFETRQME